MDIPDGNCMSNDKKVQEEVVPDSVATEEGSSAKVAAGDGMPNKTIEPVEDGQMAIATDLPCSSNNTTAVGVWECDKNGNIFCQLLNTPANKDEDDLNSASRDEPPDGLNCMTGMIPEDLTVFTAETLEDLRIINPEGDNRQSIVSFIPNGENALHKKSETEPKKCEFPTSLQS